MFGARRGSFALSRVYLAMESIALSYRFSIFGTFRMKIASFPIWQLLHWMPFVSGFIVSVQTIVCELTIVDETWKVVERTNLNILNLRWRSVSKTNYRLFIYDLNVNCFNSLSTEPGACIVLLKKPYHCQCSCISKKCIVYMYPILSGTHYIDTAASCPDIYVCIYTIFI